MVIMQATTKFISLLLVVFMQSILSHQTAGLCSTVEERRAAVASALASIGCDNYDCGKCVPTRLYHNNILDA